MKQPYKLNKFSEFNLSELRSVYESLDPDGDSKAYIDALAVEWLKNMEAKYGKTKHHGIEMAKEVVLCSMAHVGSVTFRKAER